ncbi:hypothetical protein TNCV_3709061 [Trichonephila clavipes]|nr:hypothetical protein TNCV_3709061 [Trichonephila clavipes]
MPDDNDVKKRSPGCLHNRLQQSYPASLQTEKRFIREQYRMSCDGPGLMTMTPHLASSPVLSGQQYSCCWYPCFFKLGKTDTETCEMKKTSFGDEAMSRARVFEWFRRFKKGR